MRPHFEECDSVLREIRLRHDPSPLSYRQLGRYGVPLVPQKGS